MSQATTWGVPGSGPVAPSVYAARDSDALDALLSAHKGPARPSYAVAGTIWLNDAAEPWTIKMFDGVADRTLGTVNATTGVVAWSGSGANLTALNASAITTGTLAAARLPSEAVQTSRQVATGAGLTGGGDLSANRTLAPDFASQAEAEAGASAVRVMSPLRVAQAIAAQAPRPEKFKSSNQTITLGGLLTIAHGLGVEPDILAGELECVTADLGRSPGAVAKIPLYPHSASGQSNGFTAEADATNVVVQIGANPIFLHQRGSSPGVIANITPSRWVLRVIAVAFP